MYSRLAIRERQGRIDEATGVLRSPADAHGADDWIVGTLCTHYAEQGRAVDAVDAVVVLQQHGSSNSSVLASYLSMASSYLPRR